MDESSFCVLLRLAMKGINVFSLIQDSVLNHKLTLRVRGSMCTDGPPLSLVLGKTSSFAIYTQRGVAVCIIHCHTLGTRNLSAKTKNTLAFLYSDKNSTRR